MFVGRDAGVGNTLLVVVFGMFRQIKADHRVCKWELLELIYYFGFILPSFSRLNKKRLVLYWLWQQLPVGESTSKVGSSEMLTALGPPTTQMLLTRLYLSLDPQRASQWVPWKYEFNYIAVSCALLFHRGPITIAEKRHHFFLCTHHRKIF